MHINTRCLAMIIGLTLMITTIAACASKSQPSTQPPPAQTEVQSALDGATLLSERCTTCHSLDRIESKHKTQEEWKSTVDRMIGKGAVLDSKELDVLVEYLVKTYGP